MDAPYQHIAAELRKRISTLAPGAKVPSNRQVAREFGVALATATRALALLSNEGLVVARPRSGTVVAPPGARRAPAPKARSFDERVVLEAVRIADSEGLDAVSMRAIATRLGVATMGLYRYVDSKDALIERMSDAAFADATLPDTPARDWRAALEQAARAQWAIYQAHPWLAATMSLARPLPLPSALAHAEWIFAALAPLGLAAPTMLHIHVAVFSYVRGIAIDLEPEARARAETGMTDGEWMQTQEARFASVAADHRLPHFARMLSELAALHPTFDFDLEGAFEFGLGPLLDGLARVIQRATTEA